MGLWFSFSNIISESDAREADSALWLSYGITIHISLEGHYLQVGLCSLAHYRLRG